MLGTCVLFSTACGVGQPGCGFCSTNPGLAQENPVGTEALLRILRLFVEPVPHFERKTLKLLHQQLVEHWVFHFWKFRYLDPCTRSQSQRFLLNQLTSTELP